MTDTAEHAPKTKSASWGPSYHQYIEGDLAGEKPTSIDFTHVTVLVGFYCVLRALWDIRQRLDGRP
jgi:hypothetical protein